MSIRIIIALVLFLSINAIYPQDKNIEMTESLKIADKSYNEYNYINAANYYEHCYKIDSTLGIVNFRLGVCYLKMFSFELSTIYFKKSIVLEYRKGDAFYNIALIFSSEQKYDLAIKYFEKALEESPNDKDIQKEIENLKKLLNSN